MFFRKFLDAALKHKKLLGAASVAGLGFSTAHVADIKPQKSHLTTANFSMLQRTFGGLSLNTSFAFPLA